jgi:hypothetical protein
MYVLFSSDSTNVAGCWVRCSPVISMHVRSYGWIYVCCTVYCWWLMYVWTVYNIMNFLLHLYVFSDVKQKKAT